MREQYEGACENGKRVRVPRSLYNAQRHEPAQKPAPASEPASSKAEKKAKKSMNKHKRPAASLVELVDLDYPATYLKPALVQPGTKRRKINKVVRFMDTRDIITVSGFTIMAAAEAMCSLSLLQ